MKSTSISWEGVAVTTANKGGNFSLVSSYVPADCVGIVSDGLASIDVRVEGCSGSITGLPGTGQVTIYAPGDDANVNDIFTWLLSIVDYGVYYPSIHPIFGPTAGRLNYVMFWSSTSWAGQPEYNAWAVNFRDSPDDLAGMLPFGKPAHFACVPFGAGSSAAWGPLPNDELVGR